MYNLNQISTILGLIISFLIILHIENIVLIFSIINTTIGINTSFGLLMSVTRIAAMKGISKRNGKQSNITGTKLFETLSFLRPK